MKENEIKTALLNEVIEMIKGNIKSGRLGEYEYRNNAYTRGLIKQVQSLLPKEEAIPDSQIKEPVIHEVKSEPTQEIKVGDEVEYFDNHTQEWQSPNKPVIFTGGRARNGNYVLQDCHGFFSMDQIRKPLQKTQEEMDREMRDAVKKFCSEDFAEDLFDEELQKLIDHGRNTKQN